MRAIGRIFAALIGFILAVVAAAMFMLAASVGFTPADPADSLWFWGNFGVGAPAGKAQPGKQCKQG